jgi:hypothetical protein
MDFTIVEAAIPIIQVEYQLIREIEIQSHIASLTWENPDLSVASTYVISHLSQAVSAPDNVAKSLSFCDRLQMFANRAWIRPTAPKV